MKLQNFLQLIFIIFFICILYVGVISLFYFNEISEPFKSNIPNSIYEISTTAHLDGIAQFIRYYDEVLTMSARNYVYTSDVKWKNRYEESAPELDRLILEAIDNANNLDKALFLSINEYNKELVMMEERAIDLVSNGKNDEAIFILESIEYQKAKLEYQNGLIQYSKMRDIEYNQAIEASTQTLQSTIENTNATVSTFKFLILTSVIIFLFILIIVGYYFYIFIISPLQFLTIGVKKIGGGDLNHTITVKSTDEINDLVSAFNNMAHDLNDSKMNLENKIQERTLELTSTLDDLKKFKKITIDRELKMIELKKQLKDQNKNNI